jgi:hypothetical protein
MQQRSNFVNKLQYSIVTSQAADISPGYKFRSIDDMSNSQINAKSFFAEGPTARGFETGDPAQIQIGVVATGNEKGVWAKGPSDRQRIPATTPYIGVEAETFDDNGVGVFGITHGDGNDGAGVWGVTDGADSAGVRGESKYRGKGSNAGEHVGAGVLGLGYYGVHGQGSVQSHEAPIKEVPVGVLGESKIGFGVHGKSADAAGVRGTSTSGVGGEFSSPHAQIWLFPADTIGPPKEGFHEGGQFFCDKLCDLYFCVKMGVPGTWKKVRLESRSVIADLIDRFGLGAIFR